MMNIETEIPGINAEAGLSLFGGEEDLYLSALRSYAANIPAAIEKLRNFSDFSNPAYAVTVHGLKGTSDTIGAESLRDKALALEKLAKDGDLSGAAAKNAELVQDAETLVADIKSWLNKQEKE